MGLFDSLPGEPDTSVPDNTPASAPGGPGLFKNPDETPKDTSRPWADTGRNIAANAYGVVRTLAGMADYLNQPLEGMDGKPLPNSRTMGDTVQSGIEATKDWAEDKQTAWQDALTEASKSLGKRNYIPRALSGSSEPTIWDEDANTMGELGHAVAGSIPSLLSSILPGTLVARATLVAQGAAALTGTAAKVAAGRAALAGTVVGGAVGGAQTGGDLFNDIQREIEKTPDDELQKESDTYRGLRDMGLDEAEAKNHLVKQAAGAKPLIMAAITTLTSKYGVEGAAARLAGGKAVGKLLPRTIGGAVGEGSQEFIENTSQELLTQNADARVKGKNENDPASYDFGKAVEKGVQGATVGFFTGGVTGAALHGGHRDDKPKISDAPVDVDHAAAAAAHDSGTPAAPQPVAVPQPDPAKPKVDPEVGAAMEAQQPAPQAAPPPAPAQPQAAPNANPQLNEFGEEDPDSELPPVPNAPVVTPEVQRAITTEAPEAQTQPAAQVQEAPAPVQTQEAVAPAANVQEVAAAPEEAPEPPVVEGRRVLRDLGAEEEEATRKAAEKLKKIRQSKAETERAAADAGTLLPLTTNEAEFDTPRDRANVYKRAKDLAAGAEKAGKELDPAWKTMLDLATSNIRARGKPAERKEGKQRYMEARRAIAEQDTKRVITPETPRGAEAARDAARAAVIARRNERADAVIKRVPAPKGTSAIDALNYIKSLVAAAKEDRLNIPKRGGEETTGPVLHLMQAAALHNTTPARLSNAETKAKVLDFVVNDLLLRSGDESTVKQYREAEASKRAASFQEGSRNDRAEAVRETRDDVFDEPDSTSNTEVEEGEAEGVAGSATAGPTDLVNPGRRTVGLKTQTPATRQVDVKEAVVAGQDKAGTFKVEARGRRKPVPVTDRASLMAAIAEQKAKGAPTPAQAQAGNYPKTHIQVYGLDVAVETPKGQTRSGVDSDGKPWSVKMPASYGYVKRTNGADGEAVDVYIGDHVDYAQNIYVVDQIDPKTGKFDEHKAMIGFANENAAINAYNDSFSDGSGPSRMGEITSMPRAVFRQWLKAPQTKALAPRVQEVMDRAKAAVLEGPTPDTVTEAVDVLRAAEDNEALLSTPPSERLTVARAASSLRGQLGGDALEATIRQAVERDKAGPRTDYVTSVATLLSQNPAQEKGFAGELSRFMGSRLRKLVGDVEVRVVDAATFLENFYDEMIQRGINTLPDGLYDPNTHTIMVREDMVGDRTLILHEATHAAYDQALFDKPEIAEFIRGLQGRVREYLATEAAARGEKDAPAPYGTREEDHEREFVAEAFSNPDFQELLAGIDGGREATAQAKGFVRKAVSVWTQMIVSIKQLLGAYHLSNTVLEQMMRAGQVLDETASAGRARIGIRADSSLRPSRNDIGNAIGDKAAGVRAGTRKIALSLATFGQMAIQGRGFFVRNGEDLLDRMYRVLGEKDATANEHREEGYAHAAKWQELKQRDPDQYERAAQLVTDATMSDIDPRAGATNAHLGKDVARNYQAKRQLARIKAEYAALKPETRKVIEDTADFFRARQNEHVTALATTIIERAVNPNLTAQDKANLIAKTLSGTLDDTDKALIGNDPVYNDLRNATGLRVSKGMYYPLMRRGDHVVTYIDKLGDLKGGVLNTTLTPKDNKFAVIDFQASTDKAARAAYKTFAETTGLKVTSVGKVRIMGGQQVSAANAVGHPHDIVYRVRVLRQGTQFFDSASEANAFRREALASGDHDHVSEVLDRAEVEGNSLSHTQLAALQSSIANRTDLSASERGLLSTAIKQSAVRLMPGNRVEKRAQPRRGVKGASTDIARNTIDFADASGSYLAAIKYMPQITKILEDMRAVVKDGVMAKGAAQRTAYFNEINKRIVRDNDATADKSPRWLQHLMALSFLDKLFSPMYSVTNGMQPAMVTLPMLGGRHGNFRASAAMAQAYNTIGIVEPVVGGVVNSAKAFSTATTLDTRDIMGSIRKNVQKASDGTALSSLLADLQKRGLADTQSGFELSAAVGQGRNAVGRGIAYADRAARQMPIAIEAMNRSVTAIAAYRLARADGKTDAEARQYAVDLVQTTQGDYSNTMAPELFRRKGFKLTLQFKKYAQMMSYLVFDMSKRMLDGKLSARERWAAGRQMMNLVGVQIAMAGTMSLPGLELLKIGGMVATMFGLPGYDDWERKWRKMYDEALGKKWGELLAKGVVSRALNIDLSGRLSLSDMWTFGTPKTDDKQGYMAYAGNLLAGAPGSLVADWAGAIQLASEGRVGEALVKAIPVKFVADTLQASRSYLGYNDKPVSAIEAGMNAFGVRSGRQAEAGEDTGRKIAIAEDQVKEGKRLRNAYAEATGSEQIKLREAIRKHNAQPGLPVRARVSITGVEKRKAEVQTLRRSLQ